MKKAHLRRWLGRAALRRTTAYASAVPTFAALHLDLFDQPKAGKLVFKKRERGRATARVPAL